MTDLTHWWPLPPTPEHDALRTALRSAWAAPERGYHDLQHLREVLKNLDMLLAAPTTAGADVATLRLAAWFHDAVYDGKPDDEELSAQWAETALADTGFAAEVARLVRLTVTHRSEPDDLTGALLCDADLAILASPPERYATYVDGVRREYAQYDDVTFALGRTAVLEALLESDHLYATPRGRELWEDAARTNVRAELVSLARVASDAADPPDAEQ